MLDKPPKQLLGIKHARMLFDPLVKSNPKHALGWITAAYLKEHAGSMVAARRMMKMPGCKACLGSEEDLVKISVRL